MKRVASPPPTGAVTFLFTDIEGSTALWQNHPSQMRVSCARHDDIMRVAIESRGGHVFSTGGDAFCAAFASPRQALEATLEAQRNLFAEEWEENASIRVRMGLHTGEVEVQGGDYRGGELSRAERLMSAGHGGQVLLSDAAYNLVRDPLPHMEPGAALRDLGEHQLKDLRHTERIYQLVVPDLPADFPPPRTSGPVLPDDDSDSEGERYGIIRPLGSGGMAEVYLAHDEVLDQDVAMKVLRRQYADDKEFVRRFRREARNAAKLRSHRNIVPVYDGGRTKDGAYFIVMEYVPGGTLKERIEREGPLSCATAIEVSAQVARALQEAHKSEVIHRDIKPQNILLTETGEVKVADFGIARAASSTTLTQADSVMGTAQYIAPEQVKGETATPRSDLYSLGVTLYEMLTGDVPFHAETPVGIAMKHVHAEFRPPRELNPSVSDELNAVVARLLAKDPEDRPADAAELLRDLEQAKPVMKEVPNLLGKTFDEAERMAGADFELLLRDEDASANPGRRIVESQDPEPDERASKGSKISIVLRDPEPVLLDVPDFRERTLDEARQVAGTSFRLLVRDEEGRRLDYAVPSRAGRETALDLGIGRRVIESQDPEPGQKVREGSTVSLVLRPPEPVLLVVPSFLDRTFDDAKRLAGENFKLVLPAGSARLTESAVSSRETFMDLPAGQEILPEENVGQMIVAEQNPEPGEKARMGSKVSIVLRPAVPEILVPDLLGGSLSETERAAGDSLAVIAASTMESDRPEGSVIDQNPPPGERVPHGSTVSVVLSGGRNV
ncbi:MAG: protein kinase domain-containing protein, partial [Rubrobacteraceae bacterium]